MRTRLLVDGSWQDTRDHLDVIAPWSGEVLAAMALATTDDVDRAVAAARAVVGDLGSRAERAAVLDRAALGLERDREALAATIAREAAKPLRAARTEVDRAVQTLRFSAAAARTAHGDQVPMDAHPAGEGLLAFTVREPLGVVAAITPFNFPLNLVAHKLGPAIAAGCPVVLKPAEKTPLSALALVEHLLVAGLDPRAVQVVTGLGHDVGAHLAAHPGIAALSFTGSVPVGHALAAAAAPGVRVLLELGSAAPLVVEDDADLDAVAERVAAHAFGHAGQSCVSVQRLVVHRTVADDLAKRVVARTEQLVVGDPMDEATDLSCLIRPDAAERVAARVDQAVADGARLLLGGAREGATVPPTVLAGVPPTSRLWTEEVFGPVVVVASFETFDEALALVAAGPDLINAGVFTRDLGRALRYVDELDAGAVLVNESPTFRADHMPYGGVGAAGTTREGPASTVAELTREKLVVLRGATGDGAG